MSWQQIHIDIVEAGIDGVEAGVDGVEAEAKTKKCEVAAESKIDDVHALTSSRQSYS